MHLEIKIKRVNDTEPAWLDLNEENYIGEGACNRVTIMENGTASGKAAIGLDVTTPDGKHVFVQFTENIFQSIHSSLQGAKQHWEANPVENKCK